MRRSKSLLLIIAILLIFGSVNPTPTAVSLAVPRAHPLLLSIAAEKPDQIVAVIVQKSSKGSDLASLVTRLGGKITKDLRIINAFAAEMPAKAALTLSRNPGVRWVSLDATVEKADGISTDTAPNPSTGVDSSVAANSSIDTFLRNYYPFTTRAVFAWAKGLTGAGIGVVVVDSGITQEEDLNITEALNFNSNASSAEDDYGHGTHISGIIAGHGNLSGGLYRGLAPDINLISLRVNDDKGMALESDVVAALQWVYDNKAQYNVRVVNISLNSTVEQSYNTSPLDAACEILWFNGVVVVVSAGNSYRGMEYSTINAAPANDPFIITVGASDEKSTFILYDDVVASFSAYGTTSDGYNKPDIIAPGKDIISLLAKTSPWKDMYPERVVHTHYFRASGTSMAAPMVTAGVALLLQDEPELNPDQVKYRLIHTGGRINGSNGGYPYLNIFKAVEGTTIETSNTGTSISQLLFTGEDPVDWDSVGWNSVGWNSVGWNSVGWNSVGWNSVGWNSMYWGP